MYAGRVPTRRADLSAPLPRGARTSTGTVADASYLVLSFPSPRLTLPTTLTDAERAIAHLLLSGLSNEEIADARRRSVTTIAKQVASVFRKLGVCSRAELASRAHDVQP